MNLMVKVMLVAQVLTYQGEEMEEDEETMADYDIQVKTNFRILTVLNGEKMCTPKTLVNWAYQSFKCKVFF